MVRARPPRAIHGAVDAVLVRVMARTIPQSWPTVLRPHAALLYEPWRRRGGV